MITVTGKTFDHRDTLKALGGRWNNAARNWEFDHLSDANLSRLRSLVGVFVDVNAEPAPVENDDEDDIISAIPDTMEPLPAIARREGKSNLFGDDPTWFNHFKDQNPTAFFGFSSLAEIIDFIERTPANILTDTSEDRNCGWQTDGHVPEWSGTSSMKHAIRLARDGWSEGMEKAERIISLIDGINAQQRKRHYSLAGGAVSVGRMLSGNPAHMSRRKKQPGHKIVTLFVDGGMSANIKPENAIIRASIIAALADILEDNGFRCEIVIAQNANSTNFVSAPAYQVVTTLKRSNEVLSINDLVFALGHPSFLRRMGFAVVANDPDCRSHWRVMGQPSSCFNSSHQPKQNEFHIKLLDSEYQRFIKGDTLEQRALSMLPFILPKGFPIEIKKG